MSPVVTSDFLDAMMTGYQAIFLDAFTKAEKDAAWKSLCLEVNSSSAKEGYNWLEAVPSIHEWLDMRQVSGLSAKAYEVLNRNYEGTIAVDRNTYEDDQYGMITPRVRQLAARIANHPAKLLFQLLNLGVSTKTYDGVEFFDTVRVFDDSGNISNIVAGAYAADGDKVRAGIAAGLVRMRGFCDNRGEYLNLSPDTLICSPVMELAVRNALLPGVSGVVRAEAQLIKNIVVSPWLTSGATPGHDYILACTTDPLKPMLFQMRKRPEFVSVDKPDSEKVFMQRLLHYGVDGRYAVALLEPRCAIQVDCSD